MSIASPHGAYAVRGTNDIPKRPAPLAESGPLPADYGGKRPCLADGLLVVNVGVIGVDELVEERVE